MMWCPGNVRRVSHPTGSASSASGVPRSCFAHSSNRTAPARRCWRGDVSPQSRRRCHWSDRRITDSRRRDAASAQPSPSPRVPGADILGRVPPAESQRSSSNPPPTAELVEQPAFGDVQHQCCFGDGVDAGHSWLGSLVRQNAVHPITVVRLATHLTPHDLGGAPMVGQPPTSEVSYSRKLIPASSQQPGSNASFPQTFGSQPLVCARLSSGGEKFCGTSRIWARRSFLPASTLIS